MKNFHILTYGCQMNEYDSRVIASILLNNGYKEVNAIHKADIIIVNTCSVREHAEQRALGRISELQKLRKRNPALLIGVVGCMAQNLGASIKRVDFIVGPLNYKKLPQIIESRVTSYKSQVISLEESLETYSDIFPVPICKDGQPFNPTAFVPIMRGCNNYCSYCIVPHVRGKGRSYPKQEILRQIELWVAKGVKEITLLGQSVNEYEDGRVNFAQLLRLIEGRDLWIKFTTSHPKNISDELIDTMKECRNVCEWLHLPIQSGSNKILELMNRKYTKEQYIDWVYKIRSAIPEISITTDIMVGFPSESEADFNETLELVKLIKFDFAYMFKYSERAKTQAYHMGPKVPEEAKDERLSELINVQNKITYEKNLELVGTTQEALVLGKDKHNSGWCGKIRQNKTVVFDGNASVGEFIKVKISELRGWTPYGKREYNYFTQ